MAKKRKSDSLTAELSEEDRDSILTLAYHLVHGHTEQAWEHLRVLYSGRVNLPSFYQACKLLERVTNVSYTPYDCCVNSCVCFAGPLQDDQSCPQCRESRYDSRGKPRNIFRYVPLIPRLQAMFRSKEMIELLKYRLKRDSNDGNLRDVFDSHHYLNLREKFVTIDGEQLPHKFGEFDTDIFIGLLLDGVSLFKALGARRSKNNYTCWPLEVVIYNLSPTIRTQLRHILSLGIIPGPREPKHLNSFLYPLYEECTQGGRGVDTIGIKDDGSLYLFPLHFYLIFATGDIKALIKVRCTKGPNAICPCHKCHIKGVRDMKKPRITTHYVPHRLPGPEEHPSQTAELLKSPKTHEWYLRIYHNLDNATTEKERGTICKNAGINGIPILGQLSSIDIANSMPYGFMHQVFLNLFPNLCRHWQGRFKDVDASGEDYRIPDELWAIIGEETTAANTSIPSSMVRQLPDIYHDTGQYNAESWWFWMTWLAPYLLDGRLDQAYYEHHLVLTQFVKDCTSEVITTTMLRRIHSNILRWHTQYEA